jgi:CRISPR-associated protein Cas1
MDDEQELPDFLPVRMLNEYVYCPRLFFYEWVEGLFTESVDTVKGSLRHEKLERKEDSLPPPETAASMEKIHSRSVTLSSEKFRIISKMDLIEGEEARVTPVDYKIGSPPENGSNGAWAPDRVQVCGQAMILRENGYCCDEGVVYYDAQKKRVAVPIDDTLVAETTRAIEGARALASKRVMPAPLVDSPKCPRCSLVSICLPDETNHLTQVVEAGGGPVHGASPEAPPIRRLVPARDDLRPLYLNTQGLYVGKSGKVLEIKEKGHLLESVRLNEISQVNLFGGIQITTQAVQTLCGLEIPVAYYSMGGWFYGMTQGLTARNIFLRQTQFRAADRPGTCLTISKALVAGKIRNQRTILQRNHPDPPGRALDQLRNLLDECERADSLEVLLGVEGNAARIYFENFAGLIKIEEISSGPVTNPKQLTFDFVHRNKRPPRDAVNAMLSLAYSMLAKDLTIVAHSVGFDPYLGFYHQPRFGRPALALDLMESFRPLIADSAVLSAINNRMVTTDDFIQVGPAVALTGNGRKAFFRAYEQRMDTLTTHPLFDYRVSYRRILEIQTRLLARYLTGEIKEFPIFVTR